MVKHKVIKAFINKDDGKYLAVGNTFTSNDEERVAFLSKSGFIQKEADTIQDNEITLTDLKTRAKLLKIKGYTTMEKEELITAIDVAEKAHE